MKTKRSSRTLLRKKLGKDAQAVLDKLDKMLEAKTSPAEIEQAVADELAKMLQSQIERTQRGVHQLVNP